VQQQAPVLPDAVIPEEGGAVALVHVDVVHAVARLEPEDLVGSALGADALAEGVDNVGIARST
jgi:hypothetical protein